MASLVVVGSAGRAGVDAGRSGCSLGTVVVADVDASRANERLGVGMRVELAFRFDRADPRNTADTEGQVCHEYTTSFWLTTYLFC